MTFRVITPGLQTTVQGRPRVGQRHLGIPASGPADPLSMALANRLLGNDSFAAALETTLTGISMECLGDSCVAIGGAQANCSVNDAAVDRHVVIPVRQGDVLTVGAATTGVRNYVAFPGGLQANEMLGSVSTYLPATIGGVEGRALREGDELMPRLPDADVEFEATPQQFRLPMVSSWSVRACHSIETDSLLDSGSLFESRFRVSNRNDRMGVMLEGQEFQSNIAGDMPSAPVFPGTVQCPGSGKLFLMSVDAQTTGGYPRVAKVARADLHILGQLRPGDQLTLIERDESTAATELREKHAYWEPWLPDIAEIL